MKEFDLIQNLNTWIPRSLQGPLGIGDDGELLSKTKGARDIVVVKDMIVENVDFLTAQAKPEQIGYKALAINLSDLAAMGARPKSFLVGLGLPSKTKEVWIKKCYQGMMKLAKRYSLQCLGGDVSAAKEVFISVTAIGDLEGHKSFKRSGAKRGHCLFVTGRLGGSLLGSHLNFKPRVEEALALRRFSVSSMIDLSDGLIQDAKHLLKASGCGLRLWTEKIPISAAAKKKANGDKLGALRNALSDGEDFELLFSAPAKECEGLESFWKKKFPRVPLSCIGEFVKEPGLSFSKDHEVLRKLEGFEHGK